MLSGLLSFTLGVALLVIGHTSVGSPTRHMEKGSSGLAIQAQGAMFYDFYHLPIHFVLAEGLSKSLRAAGS